jgi:hypothetical protein
VAASIAVLTLGGVVPEEARGQPQPPPPPVLTEVLADAFTVGGETVKDRIANAGANGLQAKTAPSLAAERLELAELEAKVRGRGLRALWVLWFLFFGQK